MGWAEDEAKKRWDAEQAAERARDAEQRELRTAESMSITPMHNLWKKFKRANQVLPSNIRLKQIYPPNSIDGIKLINEGMWRIQLNWLNADKSTSTLHIYYDREIQRYKIQRFNTPENQPSTILFLPDIDIELVLKAIILGQDAEQLYAELHSKHGERRIDTLPKIRQKEPSFWERVRGY